MKQDMILILDLGSEENPRLAREIRAMGVYTEIHPHDITADELAALPGVKGVILNGGVNRGVDGVVIACVDFSDPQVLELVNSNLPVVTIDHVFNNRSAVLSDNAEGIRTLVEHLIRLGHRRIAYIHGERHSSVTEKRLASFYKTCADHGNRFQFIQFH